MERREPAHSVGLPAQANRWQPLFLLFACVLPSLVTLVYFIGLGKSPSFWQYAAYVVGKTLQFSLPIFWMSLNKQQPLPWKWDPANTSGWRMFCLGGVFGALVMVAILAGYLGLFRHWPANAGLAAGVQQKVQGLALNTPMRYLMLSVFYCVVHSFLEEYYWRWMVYGSLREHLSEIGANLISSLAFMAHHVLVLGYLTKWSEPWAYVLSLGVAVGGSIWAVLYERSKSLIPPWFSHLLIDAGLLGVGYFMLDL